jgi:phage terminase large subunit GpA-like protein
MKAQAPAEGILKRYDWGDSKWYQVVCSCGQEYHDHSVEVEASDHSIDVTIHATAKTDY